MLKKSYLGFIIWMLAFTVFCIGIPFLFPKEMDGMVIMRIVCSVVNLAIVILMLMMYLNERVFWLNGITYEQAVQAGSARRKRFAFRHLRLFGIFSAAVVLFSVVAQLLDISAWVDLILSTFGMVACAFYSIRYKL